MSSTTADTTNQVVADAWREYAPRLAAWVDKHLVARRDVWGGYLPKNCRENGNSVTKPAKEHRGKKSLTLEVLATHFRGAHEWDIAAIHPAGPDNLCRFIVIDIDQHGEKSPERLRKNLNAAVHHYKLLQSLGFSPWLFDSNGKGGFHIWCIFAEPVTTRVAHHFAKWIVRNCAELGLDAQPESFPKSEHIDPGAFGTLIRLPGHHHTYPHWMRLFNGSEWLEGAAVCECIINTAGDDITLIPDEALPPESVPALGTADQQQAADDGADRLTEVEIAERCLRRMPNPDFDYDTWLTTLAAAHSVHSNGQMQAAANAWSQQSTKHDQRKFDQTWKSFKRSSGNVTTLGTLVHLAKQHGYDVYAARREELRRRPPVECDTPADAAEKKALVLAYRSAASLVSEFKTLREPVIEGLLRAGEIMNVIAPPKRGKTWLVTQLVLCFAACRLWLDTFRTAGGKVLVIDNELHPETSAHRLPLVAGACGILWDEISEIVFVDNLRGRIRDLLSMGAYFNQLTPGEFRIIVLDAFYRFLPQEMDENSNGGMTALYNFLDIQAHRLGCAFVLIHHTSKGVQGGKNVTDVGSGAGAQSRATDCHLVLRDHEQDGVVVLDAAPRSWPPVKPICLRWDFPRWILASEYDPTLLRKDGGRKAKDVEEEVVWTAATFTARFITSTPKTKDAIVVEAASEKLSDRKAVRYLRAAVDAGIAHRWVFGSKTPEKYATIPPTLHDIPATGKKASNG